MRFTGIVLLVWMSIFQARQGVFVCKNAHINIFSSTPIEDIDANSIKAVSVYNANTGDLEFSLPVRSLHFQKSLMEEHFNENYIESDKFPKATFKGKIQSPPDVSKDGTYPVIVTGDFQIHGITRARTISGTISVVNGIVTLNSEFTVKCADHNIDIPQIVFHNIAESIRVRVSGTYAPFKN